MSMWRSSEEWRPRQFGWMVPAELPPFIAWLLPSVVGGLALLASRRTEVLFVASPERLSQLGFFDGYWAWTLLYAPLWGFPAIIAALPVRGILLSQGLFGWASAALAGLLAGLAIPLIFGSNFWLVGPAYGAAFLLVQYFIYLGAYGSDVNFN